MAAVISKKSASYFDLAGFFETVFLKTSKYGFLYNYPGWDDNPSVGVNAYMFWDDLHPSGPMHQLIANDFIQSLKLAGLVPTP
jgi:phospholipase/lecithinase/hemolysin